MLELSSANGGSTTTPSGHTVAWAICRQPTTPSSALRHRNGAGRCAQPGATRPAPLPHRAEQAQMTNRLYSSLDEKRGSGQGQYSIESFEREGLPGVGGGRAAEIGIRGLARQKNWDLAFVLAGKP